MASTQGSRPSARVESSGVRVMRDHRYGPDDVSVLSMQAEHRSEDVSRGQDARRPITFRHHLLWPLDARVRPYVIRAGFYGITQIGHIKLDHGLLTVLVEQWRRETHTFHLRGGEMTVTLQDVAVLLGLRVDGSAVTGHGIYQWDQVMQRLLGRVAHSEERSGASLSLTWLAKHFSHLNPPADDASEEVLQQYARAYILAMFGSILFTSTTGDNIPLLYLPLLEDLQATQMYSWGGAVLACLYRNLCRGCLRGTRQMGGCVLLLQLWSWERLHLRRPELHTVAPPRERQVGGGQAGDAHAAFEPLHGIQDDPLPPLGASWRGYRSYRNNPKQAVIFSRNELDRQDPHQVEWMPYTSTRLTTAPVVCREGSRVWRAVVPLICFEIVELHCPDRVMRQFGLSQHIPDPVDTSDKLHNMNRRGRGDENWADLNASWILQWDDRLARIIQERLPSTSLEDYMHWYLSITRRFINTNTTLPSRPVQECEQHGTRLQCTASATTVPSQPVQESEHHGTRLQCIASATTVPSRPVQEYEHHRTRLQRVSTLALTGARRAAAVLRDAVDDTSVAIAHDWLATCLDIFDVVGEGYHLAEVTSSSAEARPSQGRRHIEGRERRRGRTPSAADFTVQHSQLIQDEAGKSSTPPTWTPRTKKRTRR